MRRAGRPAALAAVVFAAGVVALTGAGHPTGTPAERVILHVMVDASEDGVTAPLTGADFNVLIGGQPQVIVEFMPPPIPLTVLFLGDVSRSVVDRSRVQSSVWIDPISSAARHFVDALQPRDRVRLMTVAGDHFNTGPAWTNDQADLQEAVRRLDTGNRGPRASPIWDGVDLAVPLFRGEAGRLAIILVTDGRASGNRADLDEAATRAMRAGVAVATIQLEATPRTLEIIGEPPLPDPAPLLERLSSLTGGVSIVARVNPQLRIHDPGPHVTAVLERLRQSYALHVSVEDPGDRSVEVRARRPRTTVHVRRGF